MNNDASREQYSLRHLDEVDAVQASICDRLEALDFEPRDIFSVRLALDESLNNAIMHGNGMDSSKKVRCSVRYDNESIWIQVEDEGVGFRMADVPDPTEADRIDQPNGRGLFVMNAFMSSIEYNDRGNCVTMCKRRSDVGANDPVGT